MSLQTLTDTIEGLSGINWMVITTREGAILHHGGSQGKAFGNYVAYAALASEQTKPYVGFNGPYHLIMQKASQDRILVLLNDKIIVGLELDAQVLPVTVIDRLSPLVAQTTVA